MSLTKTGYPLKIFKYILERDEDEIVDTVLSYCHYSLNNTQLNDLIPFLEEKKVGIINAAPLRYLIIFPILI